MRSSLSTGSSSPPTDGYDEEYVDDLHGGTLDPEEVRKARRLELEWPHQRNVIALVDEATAAGQNLIDTKCVDIRKAENLIRLRLCARED